MFLCLVQLRKETILSLLNTAALEGGEVGLLCMLCNSGLYRAPIEPQGKWIFCQYAQNQQSPVHVLLITPLSHAACSYS